MSCSELISRKKKYEFAGIIISEYLCFFTNFADSYKWIYTSPDKFVVENPSRVLQPQLGYVV